MIELERHIEILLLSNDCVIVPELGGFMAHHIDASYSEEEGLFLPPLRTLGFNPQLRINDHLLVQSYIEAYDISYPEALRRIEDQVTELRQHLENEGCYEMNDIGVLQMNEEGNLEFEPCEAGLLTPELYGLSSFEMPIINNKVSTIVTPLPKMEAPIEEIKEDVLEQEEVEQPVEEIVAEAVEDEDNNSAITIPLSWVRNAVAVAAAILLFFSISTPISNSESSSEVLQSTMLPISLSEATPKAEKKQAVAKEETITEEQTVVKEDTATEELALVKEQTVAEKSESIASKQESKAEIQEVKSSESYTIVLASQTLRRLAENFVEQLQKKGYNEVKIVDMEKSQYVRVVFGTYPNIDAAHDKLRSLRSTDSTFSEAWVFELK